MPPAPSRPQVPRPPRQALTKAVSTSKTSSSQLPIPVPERRTPPPRPQSSQEQLEQHAESSEDDNAQVVQTKPVNSEDVTQAALQEMARRAAQIRGNPSDGIAPVAVPRKKLSSDSPAVKALEAKKEEIAKKIASGSVAWWRSSSFGDWNG